jgi:hypothetical protein
MPKGDFIQCPFVEWLTTTNALAELIRTKKIKSNHDTGAAFGFIFSTSDIIIRCLAEGKETEINCKLVAQNGI